MSAEPDTANADWTIVRLLSWTNEYLTRQGVDEARLASEVLLAHATRRRRIDLYAHPDDVPDEETVGRFRSLVQRAARHEPVAYLVGEKEFFSLTFTITPDVLIPRPETETMVEKVIDHCVKTGLTEPWLLDVGTGSGCVAIAVLVHSKGARVVATDISAPALKIARLNAERHGVNDRFTAVEADRLALPQDVVPDGGFDVLMSNPPYIASNAVDELDTTVRAHEPVEALTAGDDGLSFYRSMAADSAPLLAPHGAVFVEVGDGKARGAKDAMEKEGALVYRQSWKDSVVGRERVLMFSRR